MEVMWIKVVILFGYCSLGLPQDIFFTHSPENLVGYRGQSAVLRCSPNSSDLTVKWKLLPKSGSQNESVSGKNLYNGVHVSDPSKYKMEGYDLTVKSLDLYDAGTYQCVLLKNGYLQAVTTVGSQITELIVIDTNPECSANFTPSTQLRDGDLIGITCLVSYLGKADPVTQCHRPRSSEPLPSNQSSNAVNGTMVVKWVTIEADFGLNGEALNCTTYFQLTPELKQSRNGSTNDPSYRYSWPTPRLNVVSKPRNLRLDPEADYYDLGDTVRCVADANPPPSVVEWHNILNGQLITGDLLIIDKTSFSPGTFKYRCVVTNALGNSNSTFTINVRGEKNGVMATFYTIGLPVLITIIALVTVIAVLVVKYRNIRRKMKNQEQSKTCAELQFIGSDLSTDYDEIIDDLTAVQSPTTEHNTTNAQIDAQDNDDPRAVLPQDPNLSYTGLTRPRHIPRPSVYTALENTSQPPVPPPDYGTTISTTATPIGIDGFTGEIIYAADASSDQVKPKTPQYVNQPFCVEVITEEA